MHTLHCQTTQLAMTGDVWSNTIQSSQMQFMKLYTGIRLWYDQWWYIESQTYSKQSEPPEYRKPGYRIFNFESYSTKFGWERDHEVLLVTPNTGWCIFTFHWLLEWFSVGGGGIGFGSKPRFLFSSEVSETLANSKVTGNERFRKS